MSADPPRIGLVLGGGGIAGLSYHAGALSALAEKTGWDPRTAEVIVGTSAGSIVASALRSHVSVSGLLETLLSIPTDPENMARLREVSGRGTHQIPRFWTGPGSPRLIVRELLRFPHTRPSRLMLSLLPTGRIPTDAITDDIRQLEATDWPDEALYLTAVRLDDGELVVFGRDQIPSSLDLAVEASCAIPAFFAPVDIDGVRYVDGGVPSITNTDLVADLALDLAVVIAPLAAARLRPRNPIVCVARGYLTHQFRREVERLRDAGTPVLAIAPSRDTIQAMGVNPMDPTRVVPVVMQASASTYRILEGPAQAPALGLLAEAGRLIPSPADATLG